MENISSLQIVRKIRYKVICWKCRTIWTINCCISIRLDKYVVPLLFPITAIFYLMKLKSHFVSKITANWSYRVSILKSGGNYRMEKFCQILVKWNTCSNSRKFTSLRILNSLDDFNCAKLRLTNTTNDILMMQHEHLLCFLFCILKNLTFPVWASAWAMDRQQNLVECNLIVLFQYYVQNLYYILLFVRNGSNLT